MFFNCVQDKEPGFFPNGPTPQLQGKAGFLSHSFFLSCTQIFLMENPRMSIYKFHARHALFHKKISGHDGKMGLID